MSDIIRPPFPSLIDSTMMSSFKSCPRKFELEWLHHWKSSYPSVDLHAGKAFAAGLEFARKSYYEQGTSPEVALRIGAEKLRGEYGDFQPPEGHAKTLDRMLGAFHYYFTQYPLETDTAKPAILSGDRHAIEFSFSEPIDFNNPETGDPLIYVGRFDMLVEYANGLYGLDDKTSKALGYSWSSKWDLRSQFTAYTWGASRAGIHLNGFLVRGVSILKTKYETMQALTYRPQWMLDRWYENLLSSLEKMKQMWESGKFDYALDDACEQYSGCMFKKICTGKNPESWLPVNFVRKKWNPHNRTEELL